LSGIMWALSCCYNELWLSALRAPRIRLIKTPGSKVYTESATRDTRCLTTEYYMVVHVKDPPIPKLSYWIWLPSWALPDPTPSTGQVDQQQLGRPVGRMPPPPFVGHPGLPDLGIINGKPMKYIHNT
jgi:hypothetical protein